MHIRRTANDDHESLIHDIMYAMAMSSAWTEDKQRGELAHRYVYPNGHIGRQPANEENRRFFECALLKARVCEFT